MKRGAFDRCPYAGIERTLAADPHAWIETRLMAAIESSFARKPMPKTVRAYLRRRLDGQAKKRRAVAGRIRRNKCEIWTSRRGSSIEAWLTARKRKHGLKGWRFIRDADWWQGPPSERAARMIQKNMKLKLDWESVRNIAYRLLRAHLLRSIGYAG